ncbi:hypothetical protein [Cohnella yongneupensis]|uniref:Uncharacterized protein n=1 Tax=Cohnella yongneupensis TaxID=425006 RepID=A0ABW0QUH2_9BACL
MTQSNLTETIEPVQTVVNHYAAALLELEQVKAERDELRKTL